jgi:ferrous iron transport protein A
MTPVAHNQHIVSLACAPVRTSLVVVSANGGQHFQHKISALGIYPDEKVEILERQNGGAVIVRVKGSRLAIGNGMSRKIKVKIL